MNAERACRDDEAFALGFGYGQCLEVSLGNLSDIDPVS